MPPKKCSETMSECAWIGRNLPFAYFFNFLKGATCEYCIWGGRALIRMCCGTAGVCILHASMLVLAVIGANLLLIMCHTCFSNAYWMLFYFSEGAKL